LRTDARDVIERPLCGQNGFRDRQVLDSTKEPRPGKK